jgi:hypothetical protein
MADGITMDTSQAHQLEVDIRALGTTIPVAARAIVAKGALNIKNRMVADARGSRHFKIAPTISYNMTGNAYYSLAEIGPDRERGGVARLAVIAYFGGRNGGGGTLDIDAGLTEETPRVFDHLSRLLQGVL